MKGLEKDKCTRCKQTLDYHERHYITETRKVNVSVWCVNCFKIEISNRNKIQLDLAKLRSKNV